MSRSEVYNEQLKRVDLQRENNRLKREIERLRNEIDRYEWYSNRPGVVNV